ncbi:unnamed protein product [Spirodela intermedia]|uniref:Uncharacterized protein n=1 Tax=Spirodela intermedia TaxID=51605 RepID=A0A7I8KRM7_SPIIN|nr:unnamed protein product [Spirodela intermedia]
MSTEGTAGTEPPEIISEGPRREKARRGNLAGAARAIWCGVLAVVLLAGIVALVLYLVYRPSKPQFTVLGAGLYELNTSSSSAGPTAVSASIQFTVSIHNPSARSSASFDRLAAYVDFNGEAITQPSPLPPLYLSRDGTGAVSPVLGGGGVSVSVSPAVVNGLQAGEKYGAVGLRLVVAGRVKYKAGPFHSPWRRVNARCELVMGLNKGVYGPATLLGTPGCSVDI